MTTAAGAVPAPGDGGTPEVRILVTGGGTGGHVSPALAVIGAIREIAPASGRQPVFRYVGSENGIESRLAREAGLSFVGVQTGKLRRSSRPLGVLSRANFADLFRLPVGTIQAARAVAGFRPDVVLATGGYVAVPPVIAAFLLRVPILIHEQTVQIGLANRIAARFATRIALTFEGALEELPPKLRSRAFVTGNPVRPAIFAGDREAAPARFGFAPEEDGRVPCIYVTGGAQGARVLNRAVEEALPDLLTLTRVIHQCGKQPEGTEQDFDRLQARAAALPEALQRRYYLTRFVEQDTIGDAFALADLVVGRSGAGTVTEVSAVGKPTVFVPLVPTGGDEQTRNAMRSVDAGAAVILPNQWCDGPHLLAEVRALLSAPERLRKMAEAARTLARPNAARELAEATLALAADASRRRPASKAAAQR